MKFGAIHWPGLICLAVSILFPISAFGQQGQDTSTNFQNCSNMEAWEPESPRNSAIKDVLNCLMAKIDGLEKEVRPFKQASGAVVAFDRSEKTASCPRGWSLFDPAGGRVIVGAGEHSNQGLSNYPAYADNPNTAIGGQETVALTKDQMPSHRHTITSSPPSKNIHDGFGGSAENYGLHPTYDPSIAGGSGWSVTQHENFMSPEGKGQPHSNMPPYISLYYCKKDD